MTDTTTGPRVGEPFLFLYGTIIPTYVRLSEKPTRDGGCTTGPGEIDAAGWFVEYTYPDGPNPSEQYRRFISFDEVL